jgi:hypothetical protein
MICQPASARPRVHPAHPRSTWDSVPGFEHTARNLPSSLPAREPCYLRSRVLGRGPFYLEAHTVPISPCSPHCCFASLHCPPPVSVAVARPLSPALWIAPKAKVSPRPGEDCSVTQPLLGSRNRYMGSFDDGPTFLHPPFLLAALSIFCVTAIRPTIRRPS